MVTVPNVDGAMVHGGWYRNQRATWFALTPALRDAAHGKCIVSKDEAKDARRRALSDVEQREWERLDGERTRPLLFVTGHSLGGAMALLATYKLASDPKYRREIFPAFAQTYTFGQPMVGNPAFARHFDTILTDRVFCHQARGLPSTHKLGLELLDTLTPEAIAQPLAAISGHLGQLKPLAMLKSMFMRTEGVFEQAAAPARRVLDTVLPSNWVQDVVPHLPPRDVGPFMHVGRHYHSSGHDNSSARRRRVLAVLPAVSARLALGARRCLVQTIVRRTATSSRASVGGWPTAFT